MFLIPCRYTGEPLIQECVKSIRQFHNDLILVVDSDSDDKSYYDDLKAYDNLVIADVANKHYVDGAVWYAYENYPNENFFYVMHDSMIVQTSLEDLKYRAFTSLMWFHGAFDNEEQKEYVKNQFFKTKYIFKENFIGLFGITFYCQRDVLKRLKEGGLDKCLPSKKNEMCGSERLWGIALEQEGINFIASSVIGHLNLSDHAQFAIKKIWRYRQ